MPKASNLVEMEWTFGYLILMKPLSQILLTTLDPTLLLGLNRTTLQSLMSGPRREKRQPYHRYKIVLSLGIKPVFITGTRDNFKQVRIANLKKVGYSNWAALILKGGNDSGSAVKFKSSKRTALVKAGYRIVGNIGDQWTDLIGKNVGARTFKLPDPMYYIG